jgi:hypothetical protein
MARLSLLAAGLLLLAGCAADEESGTIGAQDAPPAAASATPVPSTTPAPTPTPTPTPGAAPEFCAAAMAVDTAAAGAPDAYAGSPGAEDTGTARAAFAETYRPLLDRLEQSAPESVRPAAATYATVWRDRLTSGTDPMDAPGYAAADSAVDAYLLGSCGYREIPAYAVEYEFDRLPDSLPAGPAALSLTNDGQELHQVLLLRVTDGSTATLDDLLALPGPGLAAKVRPVADVVAGPGTTNTSLVQLDPGRYVAVCYVPVGSKRGAVGDGEPHHAEGMAAELTVT